MPVTHECHIEGDVQDQEHPTATGQLALKDYLEAPQSAEVSVGEQRRGSAEESGGGEESWQRDSFLHRCKSRSAR